MDSSVAEETLSRPVTRSTRASRKASQGLSFEATPRGPLERTKRKLERPAPVPTVNGTKDGEKDSEDEAESPNKKNRQDDKGAVGGEGDKSEMDVEEPTGDMQKDEDQEMAIGQDSFNGFDVQKICKGALGSVNLSPRVVLGERCRNSLSVNEDPDMMKPKKDLAKPAAKASAYITKSATQIRLPVNRHDEPVFLKTSISEYRRTMEHKAKSTVSSLDKASVNHFVPSTYVRPRVNNIPRKETVHPQKSENIQKTVVTKTHPRSSSRGFTWCWWGLVLLVLFISAPLLTYKILTLLQNTANGGGHPYRPVKPEKFTDHLSLLETQFPSQRPELWKRIKIHLEKHLKTAHPTEPVSLIFTAVQKAERTLHCLAQGLAASFSSALNASFIHIDGTSKAGQDSDQVKMDIDRNLQRAFEGDKPVAIIHRFEELPPGSTLIFYRYCDHENAAYKQVFLLFTVLLPQDELTEKQSLKEVEEMVQDYVKERLVGSTSQAAFDIMDSDKFSGLWSRISHLILPVVSEVEVEQKGC